MITFVVEICPKIFLNLLRKARNETKSNASSRDDTKQKYTSSDLEEDGSKKITSSLGIAPSLTDENMDVKGEKELMNSENKKPGEFTKLSQDILKSTNNWAKNRSISSPKSDEEEKDSSKMHVENGKHLAKTEEK